MAFVKNTPRLESIPVQRTDRSIMHSRSLRVRGPRQTAAGEPVAKQLVFVHGGGTPQYGNRLQLADEDPPSQCR